MASKTQPLITMLLLSLLLLSHLSSSHGCPVVTYWGQNRNEGELNTACDTGNYEIINIAFLNKFGNGQPPEIDLSGHCNWNTPSGEPVCTGYASQIAHCQALGIKIFLSLGGYSSQYTLASAAEAKELADHLWTHYLSGQAIGPLGLVALNGIDFDIRAGTNLYWDILLRDLYVYTQQKKFYLSAAPQCPIPDYYLDSAMRTGLFDYIWIQFYNNPPCEYTDDGDTHKLINSWNQWTTTYTATKFYVGLPASPAANDSAGGYVPIDVLNNKILPQVETSPKFGGVALWSRYYDYLSGYSGKINCTAPAALKVVRAPLVAMMKSASDVLYRVLS
ncbi:hevamine-A-like [Neltuma alba]|uniref:hevamine-A-like n=1 Tax=Neltuma alba TaxID=207710 RepID=UPI0010A4177F|nr:hevamine-A-like [Prosopis alba]